MLVIYFGGWEGGVRPHPPVVVLSAVHTSSKCERKVFRCHQEIASGALVQCAQYFTPSQVVDRTQTFCAQTCFGTKDRTGV